MSLDPREFYGDNVVSEWRRLTRSPLPRLELDTTLHFLKPAHAHRRPAFLTPERTRVYSGQAGREVKDGGAGKSPI